MAHLQDPEQGYILGEGDDVNWTWLRIVRLHQRVSDLPECTEPFVYGANILREPGFESGGGGPLGNEVPGHLGPPSYEPHLLYWSDDSEAPLSLGWYSHDVATNSLAWRYSTASPLSGSTHLRATGTSGFSIPTCYALGGIYCNAPAIDWESNLWAARVDTDDVITLKVNVKSSSAVGSIRLEIEPLTVDGILGSDSEIATFALTTSYTQRQVVLTVPALDSGTATPIGYVRAGFRAVSVGTGQTVDVDDCTLEVVAA